MTPGQGVSFKRTSHSGEAVELPCGQCIGCRIKRANDWAIRLMHEKQMHEDSIFLTLTYSPEHYPENGSLDKKHFQDFMKRYRKAVYPKKLRFLHCGEYGETTERPHYHALIFGHRPTDLVPYKKNHNGNLLYTSAYLEALWGLGFVTVGEVSYQSANYVARYIMKKVNGDRAVNHYRRVDAETGEIVYLQPEYITMSRRPGIGQTWLDQFASDVFPGDFCLTPDGKKTTVPTYYTRYLKEKNPKLHRAIQRKRISAAKSQKAKGETSEARLVARETCKKAKLNLAKRETI